MKKGLITFALALFVCLATPAFATTRYVDTATGNDSNNGLSTGAAKKTIGGCIAVMSGGDTCLVRAGTYHESVFITLPSGTGFPSGATTIQNYMSESPTMNGSLTIAAENNIIWDGVNIDDAGDGNDLTDCVLINTGNHIKITNAELKNCQRHGILTGDGNGAPIGDLTFSNLNIHNTGQGYMTSGDPRHHNIYLAARYFLTTGSILIDHINSHNEGNPANAGTGGPSGGAQNSWGIQIYTSGANQLRNVTVSNNYVHDNNQGMVIGSGADYLVYNNVVVNNDILPNTFCEGAITLSYGTMNNIQLYNNTIAGNGCAPAIELGQYGAPANTVIKNNIFYGNATDGVTVGPAGATGTVQSNNFTSNPSFVGGGDYHLQMTSAATGTALNESTLFTTDRDGTMRPASGSWDPGAYVVSGGGGGGSETGPFTYYVDAGAAGNDSNTCTQARTLTTAKKTLNNAVTNCMTSGDTIIVRVGNYTESLNTNSIPSGTSAHPTTIKSYSGEIPVLKGSVWISSKNYITIDGLSINGTSNPANSSEENSSNFYINAGTNITYKNAEVFNCQHHCVLVYDGNGNVSAITLSSLKVHDSGIGTFTTAPLHNFYISGDGIHGMSTITIDHVESYNAKCPGSAPSGFPNCWGAVAYTTGSDIGTVTISNSYFHDNNQGIAIGGGPNHKVYNNILYNNALVAATGCEAVITVGYGSGMNNILIYNNTIVGNAGCGAYAVSVGTNGSPANTQVKNNIFYQNGHDSVNAVGGTGTVQSNNFTTNPLFVNASIQDYHLQTGSTALCTGVNLYSVFTTDKDGDPRPSVTAWDPGMDQVSSCGSSGGGGGGSSSPPAAPNNLVITVQLTWTSSTGPQLKGYNVYRSTTSGVFSGAPLNGNTPVTTNSFTDFTVKPGHTYYYVIRAVNTSNVESLKSNQITAVR